MPSGRKKPVKARRRWRINPRTRVEESAKAYRRPKAKKGLRELMKAL
jgi:hypothetical protein